MLANKFLFLWSFASGKSEVFFLPTAKNPGLYFVMSLV